LLAVIKKGKIGESYNICSGIDRSNIEVAQLLCEIFDELNPRPDGRKHFDLIQFVADRPGHDFRYALDCSKIFKELGWGADISLKEGSTFLAYKLQ
jgi:dTDP-glucose 4,6-dehydratase